jgi:hypothetical protein
MLNDSFAKFPPIILEKSGSKFLHGFIPLLALNPWSFENYSAVDADKHQHR